MKDRKEFKGKIIWWADDFFPTLGGGPSYAWNLINNFPNYEHIIITKYLECTKSEESLSSNVKVIRFPSNFKNPQTARVIRIYGK